MKLLNQLERKMYRLRIAPFFHYVIFAMAGVYALDLLFPSFGLIYRLSLIMPMVYGGEVWRLVSFIVLPSAGNILYAALSMYFYYIIGTTLESKWGPRRFLLYFLIGVLGAILAAVITQFGTNRYLFLSMFFAYAMINPEQELLLFFVVPVKMKWIALLNAVYFIYVLIVGSWSMKAAVLLSLLNLFLFFGGDIINLIRRSLQQYRRRRMFRKAQQR